MQEYNLNRFLDAQKYSYEIAVTELKNGRKLSHWMWYIFPQIEGLGFSSTSKFYAISGIDEAKSYLEHEILGTRLKEISNILLQQECDNARQIFGTPDDLKLRSSMTLFASIDEAPEVFSQVLDKFYSGKGDTITFEILSSHQR